MKKALPENAKIAKDAKECVQECVSEFISFITSEYLFNYFMFCFSTLFFSSLLSYLVRPVIDAQVRKGRLSMEMIFYLQ
jgi:hypothetical protein